ncbi:DUF3822 family protein [Galbibacter mesophilus]|uniref:DUF3822 family protein n=1 Tax=Galbibacter mesophilus TaxID=379069 RepID=UPI00191F392D|nr:DUF3822 family protein [Galbibacter mesophilus]MCM5662876.1 DUF3822 family protein [Galbibacter mesophilus]
MTQKTTSNTLSKNFKELSIQVSLSGLSFCILDTAQNKIEKLDTVSFNQKVTPEKLQTHLNTWFEKESIKSINFQRINVIHENELSAFIPKSLFNESNLSNYLKYNVKLLETDYINYDELTSHDIFNVYVPFTNINNYLFEKFGDFEYKHFSTVLLETLFKVPKKNDAETVFVHVCENHFEIVVLHQKKLILYNTFSYQEKEDFLYYLLFTIEQLNLNPEETPTYLFGAISKEHALYTLAYKYIRNLEIIEISSNNKEVQNLGEINTNSNTVILLNSL